MPDPRVTQKTEITEETMSKAATVSKRGKPVARRPIPPGAIAYGVPDAAAVLGVSPATVWRMLANREIEGRKIGQRTVIAVAELQAYFEGTPARVTKPAQ